MNQARTWPSLAIAAVLAQAAPALECPQILREFNMQVPSSVSYDRPRALKAHGGLIYVTSMDLPRVEIFTALGSPLEAWDLSSGPGAFTMAYGIEVTDTEVYLAGYSGLKAYSHSGVFLRDLNLKARLGYPVSIVHDRGFLYVADNSKLRIFKLDLQGNVKASWTMRSAQKAPAHLAVVGDYLYAANQFGLMDLHGIEKFTLSGGFVKRWDNTNQSLLHFEVDGLASDQGNLYVLNSKGCCYGPFANIYKLDQDLNKLGDWRTDPAFDAAQEGPAGLSVANGEMIYGDWRSMSIKAVPDNGCMATEWSWEWDPQWSKQNCAGLLATVTAVRQATLAATAGTATRTPTAAASPTPTSTATVSLTPEAPAMTPTPTQPAGLLPSLTPTSGLTPSTGTATPSGTASHTATLSQTSSQTSTPSASPSTSSTPSPSSTPATSPVPSRTSTATATPSPSFSPSPTPTPTPTSTDPGTPVTPPSLNTPQATHTATATAGQGPHQPGTTASPSPPAKEGSVAVAVCPSPLREIGRSKLALRTGIKADRVELRLYSRSGAMIRQWQQGPEIQGGPGWTSCGFPEGLDLPNGTYLVSATAHFGRKTCRATAAFAVLR